MSYIVDGDWDDWDDWTPCTVTCGGGSQSRGRTCTNPPPQHGGSDCKGVNAEDQHCNLHPCPSK